MFFARLLGACEDVGYLLSQGADVEGFGVGVEYLAAGHDDEGSAGGGEFGSVGAGDEDVAGCGRGVGATVCGGYGCGGVVLFEEGQHVVSAIRWVGVYDDQLEGAVLVDPAEGDQAGEPGDGWPVVQRPEADHAQEAAVVGDEFHDAPGGQVGQRDGPAVPPGGGLVGPSSQVAPEDRRAVGAVGGLSRGLARQQGVDGVCGEGGASLIEEHEIPPAVVAEFAGLVEDEQVWRDGRAEGQCGRLGPAVVEVGEVVLLLAGAECHLGEAVADVRAVQLVGHDGGGVVGRDRHQCEAPLAVLLDQRDDAVFTHLRGGAVVSQKQYGQNVGVLEAGQRVGLAIGAGQGEVGGRIAGLELQYVRIGWIGVRASRLRTWLRCRVRPPRRGSGPSGCGRYRQYGKSPSHTASIIA